MMNEHELKQFIAETRTSLDYAASKMLTSTTEAGVKAWTVVVNTLAERLNTLELVLKGVTRC